MKRKRRFLVGGAAILLLVVLLVTLSSPRYKAAKLLSTDFPKPTSVQQWKDNHGGFFGDGVLYGKLLFEPHDGKALTRQLVEREDWRQLPLPDNLKIFLFGGEKDGVHYGAAFSEEQDASAVTEGYYYIFDRKHKIGTDTLLIGDSSTDVTVGVYDSQRSVLYVMSYDS